MFIIVKIKRERVYRKYFYLFKFNKIILFKIT